MAQDTFADFDATSSNNSTVEGDATDGSVDITEGCLPGNINNAIRAIMAAANKAFGDLPSGTSRPSYLTSGKFWKDTTTAASPIIKFYDGTDDITVFTIDTSANTVSFPSGSGDWTLSSTRSLPAANTDSFTGLPSGLTMVGIVLSGVSLDGAEALGVRIGDSGGIETSGYSSTAINLEDSAKGDNGVQFLITQSALAADVYSGTLWLTRADTSAHLWSLTGKLWEDTNDLLQDCAGVKTLSAELTQIQLRGSGGSASFDSGSWKLIYA